MSDDSQERFRNIKRKPGLQIWTINVSQDLNKHHATHITVCVDILLGLACSNLIFLLDFIIFNMFLLFSFSENADGACFSQSLW